MHHAADAYGSGGLKLYAVFFLHVLQHVAIAVLKALPNIIQIICPDVIDILVFPVMVARGDRLIVGIDKYGLDPCGAKLNSNRSSAV